MVYYATVMKQAVSLRVMFPVTTRDTTAAIAKALLYGMERVPVLSSSMIVAGAIAIRVVRPSAFGDLAESGKHKSSPMQTFYA